MSIQWSHAMSTGIAQIDEQHRQMIAILNTLIDAVSTDDSGTTVPAVLQCLRTYAHEHFACEESCMDRYRCPTAAANRTDHRQFLQMLETFEAQLAKEGITRTLALEVERRLATWVIEHIGCVDRELVRCVPAA